MAADDLTWRHDVGALVFRPNGHEGSCFIHRLAFRSMSGEVGQEGCEAYFRVHRAAFERAARAKIRRAELATEQNFHLTSRDVRRGLTEADDPVSLSVNPQTTQEITAWQTSKTGWRA